MSGLQMKYFVIKPKSKHYNDQFAHAARMAMHTYADCIEVEDAALAKELRSWVRTEELAARNMRRGR